ncbi:MAG: alpha/beta hydrolase [Pseudomonadota bacterium]|nr:alpha/beta hydrolase [Pseudomonadota bacterium]
MTIVLIPGFMLDQRLWDDMLPFLPAPQHFADIDGGVSIHAMARAALASAPPAFILLGFSMGGYVAREMAYLAPDRVQALILVATSARPDQPALVQQRITAARQMAGPNFPGLSKAAIRASLHASRADDIVMIQRVRNMGARLGSAVLTRQSAVVRTGDVDRLGQIACPTLVIAADGDQLRAIDEARELASGIPGASLAVVKQSGHMLPLEAPQVLGGVITQWLNKISPESA